MSSSKPSQRPCVCFIEDDHSKRRILQDDHSDLYLEEFDLRFVICEQQFWDFFGETASSNNVPNLKYAEYPEGAILYHPDNSQFPTVFVIDMMVQWKSKFYDSRRPTPDGITTNRAGLRIGEQLTRMATDANRRLSWFYWTAVDCEDIRDKLKSVELLYKDSHGTEEILHRVAKSCRRLHNLDSR